MIVLILLGQVFPAVGRNVLEVLRVGSGNGVAGETGLENVVFQLFDFIEIKCRPLPMRLEIGIVAGWRTAVERADFLAYVTPKHPIPRLCRHRRWRRLVGLDGEI